MSGCVAMVARDLDKAPRTMGGGRQIMSCIS
jgi:hypothetical protein